MFSLKLTNISQNQHFCQTFGRDRRRGKNRTFPGGRTSSRGVTVPVDSSSSCGSCKRPTSGLDWPFW